MTALRQWLADNPTRPLLVVLGPTASGKTALAIKLAKKFNGEIISADSRQIYRETDLGTAKPTPKELQAAPHYLISKFPPSKLITVASYRRLAEKQIREVLKKKKLPILCGSHNLLISAIIENYRFPGQLSRTQRNALEKIYETRGGPMKLWKQLKKINITLAKKIPPENRHHLINTLARLALDKAASKGPRRYNIFLVGLNPSREKLYKKIDARVDKMLKAGLLKEVKNLAKRYPRHCPALRGHGYRELLDYLHGEKSLEQAVKEIKRDTRHYAKRQQTWWRNSTLSKEIHWIE